MATLDYSKYLFKDPNVGVYSLVGGTARPISDASSIDPAILGSLQTKAFGTDTTGYDPAHGGGTTGGAQTFASLQPNIYAMDATYKGQVDAANLAANPNINQMPATKSPAYGSAAYIQQNPSEAFNLGATGISATQPSTSLPPATEAPQTAPKAGYIKAYDTNNGYKEVYVQPGKYYQGVSLTPKPSSSITPETLKTEPTLNVASGGTDTASQANAMVAGSQTALSSIIAQLTPPETEADRQKQNLLDQMVSLTSQEGQKAADQLTQEQSAGLPQLRQQFADINAQILSKSAEYDVLQRENANKPITMNSIIGNERAILNAKAADIGLLQAKALGLQGKIADAQETVNRAVDLKYSTVEFGLKIREAQLNALQPTLDKQEKIQAQAIQLVLQQQQQALVEQKNEQKAIQGLMLDALKSGVTDQNLLNQISSSSTYAKALDSFAKITSKVSQPVSSGRTIPVPSEAASPEVQSWVNQINAGKATISSVPAKIKSAVVTELDKTKPPADAKAIEIVNKAQQQVDLADSVLNSPGFTGAVGPNKLARFRPLASITGATANFISSVEQLTNQQTLNNLLSLKQAGGTLGALNESELVMLQNSATKINNWALRDDKGKVVAYQASEKDFRDEVNKLKSIAQKAITNSGVNTSDPLGLGFSDPLKLF